MAQKGKHSFRPLISFVERVGNHLPHPFFIFIILIGAIFILSFFLSRTGISASYLSLEAETQQRIIKTVSVRNLFEKEMLQSVMANFVKTFVYFVPVGFVIIMVLGVSLAEQTGFFTAAVRLLVYKTPPFLVTFVVAVAGICANIASDAGIIIAPTLGGAIFLGLGRHPVAGVCTGYAASYAGFSANIFIAGTDVVLAGITKTAVSHFDLQVPVHPLMNWYIMIASTFVLAAVVCLVTEKVIVPYLGAYDPPFAVAPAPEKEELRITRAEKKGLLAAGAGTLGFVALLLLMTLPANGLLRNSEGKLLPSSPLIEGIIFILFCYFLLVGVIYGLATKAIRSGSQIPKMMEKGLVGVAGFLLVCLPASIFIDLLQKSNLTTIIAVKGAHLIKSLQVGHIPTLLAFAFLCSVLNLFVTSGLTKWLILAPIFVPMFYQLGIGPAIAQMSYRIGDSTTNVISPVSAYLPFLLGLLEKYKNRNQEIGIGSAISLMIPYSLLLLLIWIPFLGLWLILGLDPGPGAPLFIRNE